MTDFNENGGGGDGDDFVNHSRSARTNSLQAPDGLTWNTTVHCSTHRRPSGVSETLYINKRQN
jgi:hypothetical protein